MHDNNQTASDVLAKLRSGESISDKELANAIDTIEPVANFLRAAGDMFHLSWRYLNESLLQLKDFREARKRR